MRVRAARYDSTVRRVGCAIALLGLVACGDDGSGGASTDSSGESEAESSSASSDPLDATSTTEAPGDSSSGDETGPPPDDPGDPWEPPPAPEPLPEDIVDQIRVDIDIALQNGAVASATQGVIVTELATGQLIYEKNPDVPLIPASNTKLFTTAAAMDVLGPEHRMSTEVFAGAAPDANGNVAGDLTVIGHHDFTFSTAMFGGNAPSFAFDRFAEQLFESGLRSVAGGVVAGGEFVYAGESLGFYDPPAHRAAAATALRSSLIAAGITVGGGASTTASFDPPAGATSLGTWLSPPVANGCVPINVSSHNEFADVLMRHIGFEQTGTSGYAEGGATVVEFAGSLGIDTAGMAWVDGSGLDRDNQVAPRQVIGLLAAMEEGPLALAFLRTLAVGGVRGTLGGRLGGADTAGRVWGKTGTLTGVIATSGIVFNRHDGRRYLFSILMNETGSASATRAVHDDVIEIVARDHLGRGERPASPTLLSVINEEGSSVIEVDFSPSPGVDAYVLWLSDDGGATFDRENARMIDGPPYRAGQLPFGPEVYFRVTALNAAGQSDPSDTYGALSDFESSRVLIVDGFDRWSEEPVAQNGFAFGHEFAARTGAMTSAGFDTVANEAVVELADYDAVIWSLGGEGVEHEAFSAAEQAIVASYLDAGGSLLVSGAEIGFDLIGNGSAQDAAFMTDVLHVGYEADDALSAVVRGEPGPLEAIRDAAFFHPGEHAASFPDLLVPSAGATAILSYRGGIGGAAGVLYEGDHTVVVLGFPIESLDFADDRAVAMDGILGALGI